MTANMFKRTANMLGVKRPKLFLHESWTFLRLERDDECHQVGFGSGWSRCGRHNVWCVRSDDLMPSLLVFDVDVCVVPL